MTIFIIVYYIALFCYLYNRVRDNKLYRAINKYIMAFMYLGLAIYTFFTKYSFASYQPLLMVALLMAFFGDIFLVFDFGRGGDFFLAGNVGFIVYEQIVLVDHGHGLNEFYWTFIVAALILCAFILGCKYRPDIFKLGKMRWPMTFYLSSIITHGITGLALIILMPGTSFALMGLGSVLFMLSDMILTAYKFVFDNNKWLIRLNSLTYFTGILLIVLATVYK